MERVTQFLEKIFKIKENDNEELASYCKLIF